MANRPQAAAGPRLAIDNRQSARFWLRDTVTMPQAKPQPTHRQKESEDEDLVHPPPSAPQAGCPPSLARARSCPRKHALDICSGDVCSGAFRRRRGQPAVADGNRAAAPRAITGCDNGAGPVRPPPPTLPLRPDLGGEWRLGAPFLAQPPPNERTHLRDFSEPSGMSACTQNCTGPPSLLVPFRVPSNVPRKQWRPRIGTPRGLLRCIVPRAAPLAISARLLGVGSPRR